mgnify:CR=1 FL=1
MHTQKQSLRNDVYKYNPISVISIDLKRARIKKGLTQKELSSLTGVSQTLIYKLESGEYCPNIADIILIADALDLACTGITLKEKTGHGSRYSRV